MTHEVYAICHFMINNLESYSMLIDSMHQDNGHFGLDLHPLLNIQKISPNTLLRKIIGSTSSSWNMHLKFESYRNYKKKRKKKII